MWFGIVFAVVVEIVPLHLRSTTIGAFLFVMNNIGGNLPILVEPTRRAIGFRESLYIYYAGFYGISECFNNYAKWLRNGFCKLCKKKVLYENSEYLCYVSNLESTVNF